MEKTATFTKAKALKIIILCAAIILLLISLRYIVSLRQTSVMTLQGRQMFLNELGWEIDPESEEYRDVVIPEELEGVMDEYNRMQRAQGYDLSPYRGKTCRQYSYAVTNYPDYDGSVIVTIYIVGRQVVAGDVHTASASGFMHSIKRSGE